MSDYRDPTHIQPGDIPIDPTKVTQEAEKAATYVRQKMYGLDVREAIALAIELMSNTVSDDQDAYNGLLTRADNLSLQWASNVNSFRTQMDAEIAQINANWQAAEAGVTDETEIIEARIDVYNKQWPTLKARIDAQQTAALMHIENGLTFETNELLQVTDLSATSTGLHYMDGPSLTAQDVSQFGLQRVRQARISYTEVV